MALGRDTGQCPVFLGLSRWVGEAPPPTSTVLGDGGDEGAGGVKPPPSPALNSTALLARTHSTNVCRTPTRFQALTCHQQGEYGCKNQVSAHWMLSICPSPGSTHPAPLADLMEASMGSMVLWVSFSQWKVPAGDWRTGRWGIYPNACIPPSKALAPVRGPSPFPTAPTSGLHSLLPPSAFSGPGVILAPHCC